MVPWSYPSSLTGCSRYNINMNQPPHIELLDEQMVAVLRKKTPAERLAIAHDMWTHARQLILSLLQAEHPDWTVEQRNREAARRLSHGAV